jgi:hypothetical protein
MKTFFLLVTLGLLISLSSCKKLGLAGNDYCKSCEARNTVNNRVEASYENCEATLSNADAARPTWEEKYYDDSIYIVTCTNNW